MLIIKMIIFNVTYYNVIFKCIILFRLKNNFALLPFTFLTFIKRILLSATNNLSKFKFNVIFGTV